MKKNTKYHFSFDIIDEVDHQTEFQEKIDVREIRHFACYKDTRLVLLIEDKPGVLTSSAAPGPTESTKHSFINGQSVNADYENDLSMTLKESGSFNEFLVLLINKGYDILSYSSETLPNRLPIGFRILKSNHLLGVIWDLKGQFTSIQLQPEPAQLIFDQATVTVYEFDESDFLLDLVESANNFKELQAKIESNGMKCQRLN